MQSTTLRLSPLAHLQLGFKTSLWRTALLFLFALLRWTCNAQAQVPNLLIQATSATTNDYSYGTCMAIDASGNVYVAGAFKGSVAFGSTTLVSAGQSDIFLAKYDHTGTLQWAKRAGGTGYDGANGIALSGNEVYITGAFEGTANFPSATGSNEITSAGNQDIFLAKYDNTGTNQWVKRAGGADGSDLAYGVAVSGTEVYITGRFSSTANFPSATGSNEITSAGYTDIFLAKYDNTGTFQWVKRAGGPIAFEDDAAYGVAVSGTEVYITGVFRGTANFNTPSAAGSNEITSAGSSDIFLAKYDNTGDFQWAKRAGGTNNDRANRIAISGNEVYITGGFSGTANFPSATGSNEITAEGIFSDIFLAKYDNTGANLWVKRAGGTAGDDIAIDVAVSGTEVFISGLFGFTANFPSATGSNEITSAGGSDIFLAKYDNTGAFKWARRAGGTNSDQANSVAVSGTEVYISGVFYDTANFNTPSAPGSNELTNTGGAFFLARYVPPTITVSTTTTPLTAFSACAGSASAQQSFTVSGSNLTANIIVSAPSGFQVSSSSGSGFTTSVTLTQNGGTVASTTLYVRMAAATSSPTNANLTCTSTGATTQNVALSGTINANPSVTITPSSSSSCVGQTLSLVASSLQSSSNGLSPTTPVGDSYSWASTGGSFVSNTGSPVLWSSSRAGGVSFTVTARNSNACSATTTFSILVKSKPTASISPSSNQSVCLGQTLNLTASGGEPYSWSGPNFSSSNAIASLNNSTMSNSGIYRVMVGTGVCTATASISVSIQQVTLGIAPNPLTVCLGQAINLSANASPAASAFAWKGPGNFSSTTQNISTYATTTANLGIYSVSATIGSCTVSTTAEVKSGAILKAGVVGMPCVGGTIQFTATGMTSYTWSRPTNNFNSTLQNPVIPSSTMNDAGVYFLSARSGSCVASTLVLVMLTGTGINPTFSVSPSSVAAGATVALSAASATGTYSWSGPNGFSGTTRTKSISNFQTVNNGVYRLTLTSGTCSGYTEKTISVNSATRLAAAENEPIEMEINAYPNPVTHTLTVEVRLKEPSSLQLNLVNSVGKVSGKWQSGEVSTYHRTKLDMSTLQDGLYLLQAQTLSEKATKRILKIQQD